METLITISPFLIKGVKTATTLFLSKEIMKGSGRSKVKNRTFLFQLLMIVVFLSFPKLSVIYSCPCSP